VGAVGLLYVGAVLFLNGVMILGRIDAKAAAVFNLFVGALQVLTPTYLIFTASGTPDEVANTILNASGIYLFGFTYLYVGITLLAGLDSTGVGWFSLFVAGAAAWFSFANFKILDDKTFGVIWIYWAFLWTLFFLLLGLKLDGLTNYTGWITSIEGIVTGFVPAMLILTGYWPLPGPQVPGAWSQNTVAITLAAVGAAMVLVLIPLTRPRLGPARARPPVEPVPAAGEPVAGRP
jgi:putative amide transporter protein